MEEMFSNISAMIPEIILVTSAMILLMVGSFYQKKSINFIIFTAFAILFVLSFIELFIQKDTVYIFNSFYIEDGLTRISKFVIFLSSSISIIISSKWLRKTDKGAFEFPILIMFSTLGMALMVSANDLISLYLAIELQSLPLYVLASFNKSDIYSSESGVKYFILGALSSGLFLYGASLIYGFTGTTVFTEINYLSVTNDIGFLIGLVFLISGIIFKISLVPFHMWAPDVYEGAATPVTSFFASVPKMAAIIVLIRILYVPFVDFTNNWYQIIVFVSIFSIALGSITAIWQTNIKRLIAYSSIAHMGFAVLALTTGKPEYIDSILIYMLIYVVSNIGFFTCLINIQNNTDENIDKISDLVGLSIKNPFLAISMGIYMFSFAGIPPLAGFFAKYFIFMAIIKEGLFYLAIFGLLMSVIGSFYYIRFVKVMFFDRSSEEKHYPFSRSLGFINLICISFVVAFIIILSISPLADLAKEASLVLN